MESPVNSENSVSTTKEPVKAEDRTSSNSGDRSDEASSPPPNCSICLGKLVNTSFTDSCLHQFCFTCLLQWSRIKTECPLCKQTFKSIIHNVRSEEDYDQYHVPRESTQATATTTRLNLSLAFSPASMAETIRRFSYRTTLTPNRRYGTLSGGSLWIAAQHARQEQVPNNSVLSVSHEERRYRRNIYRTGVWSDPIPDIHSRFRECSAEYYRRFPQEIDRLVPWINRDLQTLFNENHTQIAYVLEVITSSLTRYDMRSPEFRNVLRPYFGINTDHFIHELMNYARTDLNITAYDDLITFLHHPNRGLSGAYWYQVQSQSSSSNSTSSTSDDSDVRVVDHIDAVETEPPSVGPHLLSVPGPSTVSQTFRIETPEDSPCVLTISSSSSESDCEIIGYVKPRHERTPEIIELLSSDGENEASRAIVPVVETPRSPSPMPSTSHPSTSYNNERRGYNPNSNYYSTLSETSSDNSDSDSDSDYSQERKQSSRRKKRSSKSNRKVAHKPSSKKREISKKRIRYSFSSSDSNGEIKKRKTTKSARENWILRSSSEDDSDAENVSRKQKVKDDSAKMLSVRVRKDLMNEPKKHTKLIIYDSTTSSYSSSDSSSDSTSSSTSYRSSSSSSRFKKLQKKFVSRQLKNKTHRQNHAVNHSDDNSVRSSRSRLKSTVIKINSTVLRKDSNKKEWYVDKKDSSRSRSRSRSSCNLESDDNVQRHDSIIKHREKRTAQKIANEKIKTESLYFMTDSANDDESQRSNSQCSVYSERSRSDKHKNKISAKTAKSRKSKSRKKSSKILKDKQKRSRTKSKRDKRRKNSSSSSSCL
ncbi:LOW QUALITY PROTEIN: E3 ubiquitin-protein ligase Topors-like [Chelonus insularis]|uniref:LOW QUALITY PROTEIN: E3 ubiquitin-protein ligase Topors-like n=1 Tax=Chelonus insularis TaxID=460826 RepID=UPI00158B865C|nr:LOW QUALITY PROTEIN: E3 ubiquitin-protein ligase Topors-like [Chelonus insularis]XP_034944951.1 LOW QUALITY PROTEIN: E3 ubiquitin-protein ligase Topors-like [Chelonus insularis]